MKTYILFFLLFFSQFLRAQTKADSVLLKQKTDEAYDALYSNLDSARILAQKAVKLAQERGNFYYEMDAFMAVAYSYYYNYEFKKALKLFKEGEQKTISKKDTLVQSKFLNAIAMCYDQMADYKASANYYTKASKIDRYYKDSVGMPISLGNLAIVYSKMGKMDSAILLQKEALIIREKLKSVKIHNNYNNLGTYYHQLGRYDLAIENYLKAAKVRKEEKLFELEAATYANLSSLFTDLNDHKNSVLYGEKSEAIFVREGLENELGQLYSILGVECFRIKDYQQAESYFNKALEKHNNVGDESLKSIDLHNLATVYDEQNKLQKAYSFYSEALVLKNKLEKRGSAVATIINLGNVLSRLNKNDSAQIMLLKGYNLAVKYNRLKEQRGALEKLSKHYEKVGNYLKSLNYRTKESYIKDSIFSEDYTDKINQLYIAFETAQTKNDLLNEQLKTDKLETQKAQADLKVSTRNNQLIIVGSLVFILLLVGGFLFYRTKQKQKNVFAQIRIEEQQKGLSAIIQAQEDERKRIAKDLHDGIVQQLGGLKLGLQKVFSGKENEETNKIVKILDGSAQELRELSHKMMPRSLGELGLLPALEDMLDNSLGNSAISYQFEHFGINSRFKENIEIAIYRIAQELVNNVIKHSSATKVNVQLFKTGNDVMLIVEDNGKGIDGEKKEGIGLMNITSRLDTINGKVNFEPSHESGTLATVKIPV
ncbi:MAG: tetratricopeptide repeat protein [Vicingaceae bacterium]